MTKIFCDKRAQWQKHAVLCNPKQLKEQSVLDCAGVLKQNQAESEATPAMMLVVFLDGLKPALERQVAIMDPKTFEDAVASATRLKTPDKTRTSGKKMGAAEKKKVKRRTCRHKIRIRAPLELDTTSGVGTNQGSNIRVKTSRMGQITRPKQQQLVVGRKVMS